MKRKNLLLLGVVALLLIAAYYFISSDGGGMRKDLRDFSIKDTASVTRIVIKDKRPEQVELIKIDGRWKVDGKYNARPDVMNVLLTTLYRQEMRNFTPQAAKERVIKELSVYGVEVQVYSGDKETKRFYVGGNAPDLMGTYMMIHNATDPYVVHIEGFNGFLNTRYFAQAYMWRDRLVVDHEDNELLKVEMNYTYNPDESFAIEHSGKDEFKVLSKKGVSIDFDSAAVRGYFEDWKNLRYEGLVVESDPAWRRRDSIMASIPIFEIKVTTRSGEVSTIKGYRKDGRADHSETDGSAEKYDRDRMYAVINNETFVLIQFYVFDKITRPISYFETDPSVVKNL
jgi:hypothetical protein